MFDEVLEIIAQNPALKPVGHIGQDGLVYCDKCNTPRQVVIPFGITKDVKMPCMCKCMEEDYQRFEQQRKLRERKVQMDRNKGLAFPDRCMTEWTFKNSDNINKHLMNLCQGYADKFTPEIKWLTLYGDTGVGKTYAACCIANALLGKGLSVRFFTLPQFERLVWGAESKSEPYREIRNCDLLIVDDLGIERNTTYMNEILFNLIDERLTSRKPAIITTNMGFDEIYNPKNLTAKRIMSRVCERSALYCVKGEDRRRNAIRVSSDKFIEEIML